MAKAKRKQPDKRPGKRLLDGWSALHFAVCAGAAFLLVPWHAMLALGVAWEALEAEFRRRSQGAGGLFEPESWRNMMADIVVDMAGWATGAAIAIFVLDWDAMRFL